MRVKRAARIQQGAARASKAGSIKGFIKSRYGKSLISTAAMESSMSAARSRQGIPCGVNAAVVSFIKAQRAAPRASIPIDDLSAFRDDLENALILLQGVETEKARAENTGWAVNAAVCGAYAIVERVSEELGKWETQDGEIAAPAARS